MLPSPVDRHPKGLEYILIAQHPVDFIGIVTPHQVVDHLVLIQIHDLAQESLIGSAGACLLLVVHHDAVGRVEGDPQENEPIIGEFLKIFATFEPTQRASHAERVISSAIEFLEPPAEVRVQSVMLQTPQHKSDKTLNELTISPK